jgi:hypothetical protein
LTCASLFQTRRLLFLNPDQQQPLRWEEREHSKESLRGLVALLIGLLPSAASVWPKKSAQVDCACLPACLPVPSENVTEPSGIPRRAFLKISAAQAAAK